MIEPTHQRIELYLPAVMACELDAEAKRQARTLSWLLCRAWELARERLQQVPAVSAPGEARAQARRMMALERGRVAKREKKDRLRAERAARRTKT